MAELKKTTIIVGMKHCGKSTAGKELAKRFHTGFTDLDELAERIYEAETGLKMSAREIYRGCGKKVFQAYENKAAAAVSANARSEIFLAAAGGGLCDNAPAVAELKQNCLLVFIDEAPEVLYARIIKNGIPAFLSEDNPQQDFNRLYEQRSREYRRIADIRIAGELRPVSEICADIVSELTEEGYAG